MKKHFALLLLAIIAVLLLSIISVNAEGIPFLRIPFLRAPAGFYPNLYFSGAGAGRTGTCETVIRPPAPNLKGNVRCKMQNNAGQTIDQQSAQGALGGWGARVILKNWSGDTGRLVLFSAHDMLTDGSPETEYKMIESSGR